MAEVVRVVAAPAVELATVEAEAVLLDVRSGRYFGLDAVARRMWEVVTTSADLTAARAQLLDEFDVDPATLARDLDTLVDTLEAHGLVRRCHAATDDAG